MMKYFNFKNNKKGFTLVEMMVAIAVFSIVMVVAMSALLNVIDANNKARSIKTAINNISFALEGISKDMRMGESYECFEYVPATIDCITIRYRSPRAYLIEDGSDKGKNKFAYYQFSGTQLYECLEKELADDCSSTNPDFSPVTSSEVTLKKVIFYILGVGEAGKQPRMIMTISGEAGTKEKIKTSFDLQTSVSQRKRI